MAKKRSGKPGRKNKGPSAGKPMMDQEAPVSPEAQVFVEMVQALSYQMGPNAAPRELTNVTFFVGAGFSKSWDPNAPIGSELFTLETKVIERVANISALHRMFGLDVFKNISPDQLRQMIYQMDMYERYPDVCSRYVDEQNLRIFRGALRAAVVDRYERLADLNYFDAEKAKFTMRNPSPQQRDIIRFFRHLLHRQDGSQPLVEGLRTQFITTNYDYVIETILDNVIGEDDSLFLYTYRGFTPEEVVNQVNMSPIHEHWLVQHLLKINGGFEILRRGNGYVLDYSKRTPAQVMADPPVLMLASREQDYTDPYFRAVFPKAVRLLRDTMVLVLVGYSLPEDDALIRFIVRQFAEEAEDGRNKAIFYIAPIANEQKRDILYNVFPSMKSVGVPTLFTYNGSFDAFVSECLRMITEPDE